MYDNETNMNVSLVTNQYLILHITKSTKKLPKFPSLKARVKLFTTLLLLIWVHGLLELEYKVMWSSKYKYYFII